MFACFWKSFCDFLGFFFKWYIPNLFDFWDGDSMSKKWSSTKTPAEHHCPWVRLLNPISPFLLSHLYAFHVCSSCCQREHFRRQQVPMYSPFCTLLAKENGVTWGETGKIPFKPASNGTVCAMNSVRNIREQESGGELSSWGVINCRCKRAALHLDGRILLLRLGKYYQLQLVSSRALNFQQHKFLRGRSISVLSILHWKSILLETICLFHLWIFFLYW